MAPRAKSSAGGPSEGDVVRGALIFKKHCAQCHTAKPEGRGTQRGPNLHKVLGAPSGSLVRNWGGSYFRLEQTGLTWDPPTLLAFLEKPKDVIPQVYGDRSCMSFRGMQAELDRADLVAYLGTV
eukprot:TRINITY_DN44456_c0_g1_i1.p1 TRINITY_DN44456_c0_g1~~TRINITY_DN44456_c0_g1_i1.p1  ORF type:complete len:124 (+),score=9.60 TRINITY_DN44456_c0_g1_i1:37-408(+)